MNRITLFFLLFWSVSFASYSQTKWPPITKECKPWTRWWWLGSDVDSLNLTYNLQEMSQAGIGGVEITPIYGVKGRDANYISYLSPTWMNRLAFTESEANRLNMGVDLNNGTGWPFGGPDVSIKEAATKAIFQQYALKKGEQLNESLVVSDEKQKNQAYLSCLMAYSAKGEKLDLTANVSKTGVLNWTAPTGEWNLIALFIGKTFQKVKRAAPGGEGYVLNHFDAQAVQNYFSKFDAAFAKSKTPFPQSFFNDSYEVYGADWTPDLLQQFERRRGYQLQTYFQELLADGSTDRSIRVIADYRETIGELLKENFTEPWTKWAHSHGATTRNQAHGSPANLIDIYASVDIPECESFGSTDFDIPGLRKDSIRKENDSDPTILKYASSAAHIAGKKLTSSETFTWLTEHFRTSLSQCKPEIDQIFTSGVNHVYFHGAAYSPKEAAWPGWKFYASVDLSPTNSIWRDAPAFFNYIARTQSFLQEGTPDNDFLLYLPIYDIWEEQRGSYFTTFAIHGMRKRLPKFCNAVEQIRANGYDLDYISDHFIETTTVENGFLKTEGGALYKALIVPAAKMIPLKTITQLHQLMKQGATIVFSEQYPSDVPGLAQLESRRSKFKQLMKQFPTIKSFANTSIQQVGKGKLITGSNYPAILATCGVEKEPFVSELGGQLIRRKQGDGHHYFMTMLQNRPVDQWVSLAVKAESALFFDPMSGKIGEANTRTRNGKTEVYMQLQPGESIILKTVTRSKVNAQKWVYYQPTGVHKELKEGWKMNFVISEPAVNEQFTLDKLGSWCNLNNPILKTNMGTARYSIVFDFQKSANKEYRLCLGDVRESAKIWVNGTEASTLFAIPFETNIGSLLKNGSNNIEIDVTNLPANRIAELDRKGVVWRIFNEINFVSITYKESRFDTWGITPSGLLGPVTLTELIQKEL